MNKKIIIFLSLIIYLLIGLPASSKLVWFPTYSDINELKIVFLNSVPVSWIPNNNASKLEYEFSLSKNQNYIVKIAFVKKESITNNELLENHINYGNEIVDNIVSSFSKEIRANNNFNVKVTDKYISYDSDENILTANLLLEISGNYSFEMIILNDFFFTKRDVIMVQGTFLLDKNPEKYINQFNNYVKSIEIPTEYKMYNSWFDKTRGRIIELLPELLLYSVFIIFILILVFLKSHYYNNLIIRYTITPILFFIKNIYRLLMMSSSSSSNENVSSDNSKMVTNSNDSSCQIDSDNNQSSKNDTPIIDSIDDSLTCDTLDDELSEDSQMDNDLSKDTQLDDFLSDNKQGGVKFYESKNK